MGSDWDVERRGLAPGGYPLHQSDKATSARENDANDTSPSIFSWTAAKEVASNIKNMFPRVHETTPEQKGDGMTAPLLVGKAGPHSIAGSVREPSESLYGGDESSIISGVTLKHE